MSRRGEDVAVLAAYIGGLCLLAAGVGIVYFPAGLIVAGLSTVASVVLYVRSSP